MRSESKKIFSALIGMAVLSGCSAADSLDPFSDSGSSGELGQRNTSALGGGGAGKQGEEARHALEVMATYNRALPPQPYYPVVKPAEVRLMWIPDHLNRLGDLVPAHYYYLRVTRDVFALQDAFDEASQLNANSGAAAGAGPAGSSVPSGVPSNVESNGGGAMPWQYKESK